MRFVDVCHRRRERRHVFKTERANFVQQSRQFLARGLALFRSDAQIEPAIVGAIGPPFAFNIKRHHPAAVIKSYAIDKGNKRRLDIFAADSHQLFLHALGVVDAFDAHLIVDSENDHAAAGVGEGDDLLRNFFGVGELYFQLEESVFAAANQSQQFSA